MIILYSSNSGELISAYYDRDIFPAMTTPNEPFSVIEIDEVNLDNRDVCRAIVRSIGHVDRNGLQRFYVLGGELYERDGWEEAIDGFTSE